MKSSSPTSSGPNHILVTGGTGFIGSNLVLDLQTRFPEADITVIDDFRSGNFKNLEGYKGDLIPGDLAHIELEYYLGDTPVDMVFSPGIHHGHHES